jgi:hypothetical protein
MYLPKEEHISAMIKPIARRSAPERPHSTAKAHAKVGWPPDFIGDIKGLGLVLGLLLGAFLLA